MCYDIVLVGFMLLLRITLGHVTAFKCDFITLDIQYFISVCTVYASASCLVLFWSGERIPERPSSLNWYQMQSWRLSCFVTFKNFESDYGKDLSCCCCWRTDHLEALQRSREAKEQLKSLQNTKKADHPQSRRRIKMILKNKVNALSIANWHSMKGTCNWREYDCCMYNINFSR